METLPKQMSHSQRQRIVVLYMAFVFVSNFTTILYFLSLYLTTVGFDISSISVGLLVYQVTKLVLEVPSGYVGDRFGHKAVGILGLCAMLGFYGLLFIPHSTVLLVGAFLLKGVGTACLSGSFEAVYLEQVDEECLVQYNVWEQALFFASYGLAALVGGMLAQEHAFTVGLIVDVIATVVALGIALGFPRASAAPSKDTTHQSSEHTPAVTVMGCIRQLGSSPILLSLLCMDMAQAFLYVGVEDFYSVFLANDGVPPVWTGISLAADLLLSAAVGFAVPLLLKRVSHRRLFVGGLVTRSALTLFFLLPLWPAWVLPVLYVIQSSITCLYGPVKRSVFQRSLPAAYRAAVLSAQSQAIAIGAICFSALSSVLADAFGLRTVLIIAFVGYGVLYGGALVQLLRKVDRKLLP